MTHLLTLRELTTIVVQQERLDVVEIRVKQAGSHHKHWVHPVAGGADATGAVALDFAESRTITVIV